ncbi:hypothetical protein PG984_015273 [Apiospora sp. TS-2023a]
MRLGGLSFSTSAPWVHWRYAPSHGENPAGSELASGAEQEGLLPRHADQHDHATTVTGELQDTIVEQSARRRRQPVTVPCLISGALFLCILIGAVVPLANQVITDRPPAEACSDKIQDDAPSPIIHQCLNSPSRAALRGCDFDVLAYAWVHPSCQNKTLTRQFLALGHWAWFTVPFPLQAPAGEGGGNARGTGEASDQVEPNVVLQGTQGDLFVSRGHDGRSLPIDPRPEKGCTLRFGHGCVVARL